MHAKRPIFAEPNARNAKARWPLHPFFASNTLTESRNLHTWHSSHPRFTTVKFEAAIEIDGRQFRSENMRLFGERARGALWKLEGSKFRNGTAVLEFTAFLLLYLFIPFVRKWVWKLLSAEAFSPVCYCRNFRAIIKTHF